MFNCKKCGTTNRTPNLLVIKAKKVSYRSTIMNRKKFHRQVFGSGWEIVEEQKLCDSCYEKHKNDPVRFLESSPPHRENVQFVVLKDPRW